MQIPRVQRCPKCDSELMIFTKKDGKPHHGQLSCVCGEHIMWTSKALAQFLGRIVGLVPAEVE
ncbi:MAG: hypothetical protein ACW99G_11640 [Candidatus Thorarchaeota archaeon]|jgi:hypothetical protein